MHWQETTVSIKLGNLTNSICLTHMFLAYLILTPTPLHGHTLLIFTNCSMKDKQNEQNPSDRTASKTSEEFPRSEENTYSSWPQWTLDKAGLLKIQLSNPYDASYSKRNSSERNSKEKNSRDRNTKEIQGKKHQGNSTSQDFKTTFNYNLTCIFLSLRAKLKKPLCPRTPCTYI